MLLYMWPEADGLPSSSPYCLKVLYALHMKRLPHQIEYVTRRPPEWIVSGKLPAAELKGEKLEDSTMILKALDRETSGEHRLYPADPVRRAETNLLEEWADESLALQLVYHRWAIDSNFEKFLPQVFGPTPSPGRDQAVKVARDYHLELFRDRGIAALSSEARLARFGEQLEILELRLSRALYLTGSDPTAADFAAFAPLLVMRAAELPELTGPLARSREVCAWMERMTAFTQP